MLVMLVLGSVLPDPTFTADADVQGSESSSNDTQSLEDFDDADEWLVREAEQLELVSGVVTVVVLDEHSKPRTVGGRERLKRPPRA